MLFGGIEAGGTKFVCVVGSAEVGIVAESRFPTTTPQETLERSIAFFEEQGEQYGRLAALGVAAFGPLDPDLLSPSFGHITTTPKPGWANADIVGVLKDALRLPVGFDTDVNGAALAEGRWGAAQGLHTFVYLTIGTGIGGGVMAQGQILHGLVHPELGHMRIPHDWQRDPFAGACPYHGDCLEGLAAGPALQKRWGQPGGSLPADHLAWELEAEYLASALHSLICILSPQRIIMGGGVMAQPQLFPAIRRQVLQLLNGYVQHEAVLDDIETYIVPPGLGNQSGAYGALALAEQAWAADQASAAQ